MGMLSAEILLELFCVLQNTKSHQGHRQVSLGGQSLGIVSDKHLLRGLQRNLVDMIFILQSTKSLQGRASNISQGRYRCHEVRIAVGMNTSMNKEKYSKHVSYYARVLWAKAVQMLVLDYGTRLSVCQPACLCRASNVLPGTTPSR